jgi:hypothetical protein
MMRKRLLIAIFLGLVPVMAKAATLRSGTAFLQIDPAAGPASLAGAYTAASGNIDSMAYNPAGLSMLKQREAAFTHGEWLMDTRYEYLAYGQPTSIGTFGVSAVRLGYGDLEGRDESRQATGDFSAYDSAYTLAYSHAISADTGLGAAVKFIERKIDQDHASSYALDFGGVTRIPGKPLQLGASILNVGPGVRFIDQTDPLPLTFALGAAYEPSRSFTLRADIKHEPNDQRTTGMTGFEFAPVSAVALRAGYQFPLSSTGDSLWDMNNVRGGLGLRFSRFRLDYALAPMGDLGLTHRFTFSMGFGGKSNAAVLAPENVYLEVPADPLLAQLESHEIY